MRADSQKHVYLETNYFGIVLSAYHGQYLELNGI